MIGTINSRTTLFAMSGLVALAALGTAGYARSTEEAFAPIPCEVVATEFGSMTSLEAIYNAQGPASGTYRLSVRTVGGPGNSNINQGGGFSASEAGPVSLGRVTVGKAPGYDISLTVQVSGQTYDCLDPRQQA